MPREKYLSWDYDNFNEVGLKPLKEALGRFKVRVVSIDGSNRPTRSGGVQTKKAVLSISDGQSLMLQVTAQGAVYQVRLNNQIIPVRAKEDLSAIAQELGKTIRDNRTQFRKKAEAKAEKLQAGVSTPRKVALSTKKKLEELSAKNSPLMARLSVIQAEFDVIDSEKAAAQAELDQKKSTLATTQVDNTELAKQIKQLEAA
jgi:chromosome segregation ATPase